MFRLFSIIRTEIQLLLRDLPGLMILFVMPMLLVLILTSLHSMQNERPNKISMIIVNHDQGKVARKFIDSLSNDGHFNIKEIRTSDPKVDEISHQEVLEGSSQLLLILPNKLTVNTKKYATWLVKPGGTKPAMKTVEVFLDPTVPAPIKDLLQAELEKFDLKLQVSAMQSVLKTMLHQDKFDKDQPVVNTQTVYASGSGHGKNLAKPNSVQQYVPAWTIFGMFLIMIPIAAIFVKERQQGVIQRLAIAPVSRLSFLFGRIITFVMINMIQMCLMFALGVFIFPLIGMKALNLSGHIPVIALTGLCVSLAATGFGVLLGTYAKTFEQAMALGPTLIVVGAAIGGIMAPLYLMPEPLRVASEYSPLFWSQDSFINILVRNASIHDIWPNLAKLIIFFCVAIGLSLFRYMRKG